MQQKFMEFYSARSLACDKLKNKFLSLDVSFQDTEVNFHVCIIAFLKPKSNALDYIVGDGERERDLTLFAQQLFARASIEHSIGAWCTVAV